MNTENLRLDPSAALPSYPLLRMTFFKERERKDIILAFPDAATAGKITVKSFELQPWKGTEIYGEKEAEIRFVV